MSTSEANDKQENGANEEKKVGFQEEEKKNNDLVIREGFPALLKDGKPLIEGTEPLPRESFVSYQQALQIPEQHVCALLEDCEKVFTARTKDDGAAYSAGCTYFVPCQMKPRCALEALAMQIFKAHTADLEAKDEKKMMYDPARSGAEWWTLVMDANKEEKEEGKEDEKPGDDEDDDDDEEDDDEVGMHFDADYGLEAQLRHMLLHPRVATVTYFSDVGAPTVIFDKRSPPPDDVHKKMLSGDAREGWLSGPKLGKHIAFDGRLLHGAPTAFFPGTPMNASNRDNEPTAKRQKLESVAPSPFSDKRITFMVNVWLNHCPIDAELIEDDICEDLKTPWESTSEGKVQLKGDDSYVPPFEWVADMGKNDDIETIALKPSKSDPAGSEETVVCHREVTINFNPDMDDLHAAARRTSGGASVKLDLAESALSIEVGKEVESDDEEEQ